MQHIKTLSFKSLGRELTVGVPERSMKVYGADLYELAIYSFIDKPLAISW